MAATIRVAQRSALSCQGLFWPGSASYQGLELTTLGWPPNKAARNGWPNLQPQGSHPPPPPRPGGSPVKGYPKPEATQAGLALTQEPCKGHQTSPRHKAPPRARMLERKGTDSDEWDSGLGDPRFFLCLNKGGPKFTL